MSKKEFLWGEVPDNWDIEELQNVALYISRGKQPKYVEKSEIRALNQKAVRWGYIDENVLKYHNSDIKVDEKHFIRKNDIVINSTGTGTVGRTYHFNYEPKRLFADSHITIVRVNKEKLNSKFLMYQLSTKEYQSYIENAYLAGSTGQVEFNKSKVQSLPILLPPLEEQEKIANILSSLDDKIELNNEMNKTLEEMAQSIFKRWFVDFEFPGDNGEPYKSSGGEMVESELGMIPRGWKIGTLDKIGIFKNGKAIKQELRNDNGKNLIYGSNGIIGKTDEMLQNNNCIIIGRFGAYCGSIQLSLEPCWVTDNAIMGIAKEEKYLPYLHRFLLNYPLREAAGGSAQPLINQSILKSITASIPTQDLFKKYYDISKEILLKIDENKKENNLLSEIRDSILPKLMSGEIILDKKL